MNLLPKSRGDWICLAFLMGCLLILLGCSAVAAKMPATQEDLAEVAESTARAAQEGNPIAAIINGLASAGAALTGMVYLSRRRRTSPQNDLETLERVKRGKALAEAKVKSNDVTV